MPESSSTHIVLIPSYNPGPQVYETVSQARKQWNPVWIVVDGSTDGTSARLQEMARNDSGITLFQQSCNRGKGAAIHLGLEQASASGFTHILTMDSDGQHPAGVIQDFMRISRENPEAMILGSPIFDASAPLLRVKGRKISNWWVNLETHGAGIDDSLFGFRVYPVQPLKQVMDSQLWMRRFDFDPEAAVRMTWAGIRAINVPAAVRYLPNDEGGVSHFHYLNDNLLLTWMHMRLFWGFLLRLPRWLRTR